MKRLLCFFDGTWNVPNGSGVVTNVVKLQRFAFGTAPDGIPQITRYVQGIGTDPGDSEREAFLEGAIGIGVDRRILEGYEFLVRNYAPGDEIHLFGFSRGAFQARSLVGLLTHVGLLKSASVADVHAAWRCYERHVTDPDLAELERVRGLCHPDARVKCLGVWDTVGNLGVPLIRGLGQEPFGFHSTELSPLVDVGLHALSIDEPRGPFSPSLWTKLPGVALPRGQVIEQVWFAGSHANVGGGFEDSSLSDIALKWMAERSMVLAGVAFDLGALEASISPDPLGELVMPTSDGIYKVSGWLPFLRLIGQDRDGIPPLRHVFLGTHRTSWLGDGIEAVNESLHPSVLARFGKRAHYRRGTETGLRLWRPRSVAAAKTKRMGLAPQTSSVARGSSIPDQALATA